MDPASKRIKLTPTHVPTHVIDPHGEVIIILRNANAPFAVWNDIVKTKPTQPTVDQTPPSDSQNEKDADSPERIFYIQVSAKHLMLASPVLEATLTGGWKESTNLLEKGSAEIAAENWDLEAFLILLRIIHCQNDKVPQELSLELFAKVTVLTDYYKCKSAVLFFARSWVRYFDDLPREFSRNAILWLWVAWYFDFSLEYEPVSFVVMAKSSGSIPTLGLPIPGSVLEQLQVRKDNYIQRIVDDLHQTYQMLITNREGCNLEARAMRLGALSRAMYSIGVLPRPVAPFPGLTYNSLMEKIPSFESPLFRCQRCRTNCADLTDVLKTGFFLRGIDLSSSSSTPLN